GICSSLRRRRWVCHSGRAERSSAGSSRKGQQVVLVEHAAMVAEGREGGFEGAAILFAVHLAENTGVPFAQQTRRAVKDCDFGAFDVALNEARRSAGRRGCFDGNGRY